jgi:hypothetical protein
MTRHGRLLQGLTTERFIRQTARCARISNGYACSVFSAIGVGSSGEWLRWDRDSMMSAPPCYSSTSVANCSTAA